MKALLLSPIPEYKALSKAKRKFIKEEARQGYLNFRWGVWGGLGGMCVRLDKLLMNGGIIDKPGIIFAVILAISIVLSVVWDLYIINPNLKKILENK